MQKIDNIVLINTNNKLFYYMSSLQIFVYYDSNWGIRLNKATSEQEIILQNKSQKNYLVQ